MISIDGGENHRLVLYALYVASFIAAFVVTIFACVCNPKSKRFHKHQSFILSHDLPNNEASSHGATNLDHRQAAESGSNSAGNHHNHHHHQQQLQCISADIESTNEKLKAISLNRALPDIPTTVSAAAAAAGKNDEKNCGIGDTNQSESTNGGNRGKVTFSNSTSNDDIDSLYTVANAMAANSIAISHINHPYARIRNNQPIDSSTENDTDDYSESTRNGAPISIAPTSVGSFRASNSSAAASTVASTSAAAATAVCLPVHENHLDPNDTYELEPQPPHILRLQLRSAHIDAHHPSPPQPPPPPPLLFANEMAVSDASSSSSSMMIDAKKEISYNTISVREPLSKVLADRENIEHHYNEVEDERISSFYEEISSAPPPHGGIATYSKINEIIDHPSSSQRQGAEMFRNVDISNSSSAGSPSNGPLYSFVEKKIKRAANMANDQRTSSSSSSRPTAHHQASPLLDANNLYTMVVKSPANGPNVCVDSTAPILHRYSPPPPLPPPLHHRDAAQSKPYRNTIMFGTPTSSNINNSSSHTVGIRSSAAAFGHNHHDDNDDDDDDDDDDRQIIESQQNIYQKISRSDSEKDPGYESVYRDAEPNHRIKSTAATDNTTNHLGPNDYGYEAIVIDEINDPAYEIVKPDNAYETIKNETRSFHSTEATTSTTMAAALDDQSDPNYEIIASTTGTRTTITTDASPATSIAAIAPNIHSQSSPSQNMETNSSVHVIYDHHHQHHHHQHHRQHHHHHHHHHSHLPTHHHHTHHAHSHSHNQRQSNIRDTYDRRNDDDEEEEEDQIIIDENVIIEHL